MCWYQKYFLKNKKIYYFNTFPSEKHFEKQPQLYFQTILVVHLSLSMIFIRRHKSIGKTTCMHLRED